MNFILLKVIGVLMMGAAGYLTYRKYRAQLTSDALITDAKKVISKLEAYAAVKAKEVEAYAVKKAGLDNKIAAIQSEVQKAQDFAAKIKALF